MKVSIELKGIKLDKDERETLSHYQGKTTVGFDSLVSWIEALMQQSFKLGQKHGS